MTITKDKDIVLLEGYTDNLTLAAQEQMQMPLAGFDGCLTRIFQILLQRGDTKKKENPLLLDMDEKRRWNVLYEVVRRISTGEAPEPLSARQVVALNYEALFADEAEEERALYKRQPLLPYSIEERLLERLWPSLEEYGTPNIVLARLQALFLAIRQTDGRVLLFINQFHRLLGAESRYGAIDASSLLKPVLARHEIQVIAACMPSQYHEFIERDAVMARRFQECYVQAEGV